jgi:tripeptidyl-peptidase-1
VLLVFATLALALASESRSFIERDAPVPLPAGWKRLSQSTSAPVRELNVILALKQRNIDHLKDILMDVSTPRSENYGKHLSLEQISELVAPSQSVIDEVIFYLKSQGVDEIHLSKSRDFLFASMSSTLASRIFNIKYDHYRHESGVTIPCSAGPYSLPSTIAQHIDIVSGIVGFPDLNEKKKLVRTQPASDDLEITPAVIRTRYNVTGVCTNQNNSRAVAEFQGQYYSPTDYKTFWDKYVTDIAPFQNVSGVIGTNEPKEPSYEGNLDIQYISGVVPGCATYFYSMKSFNFYQDLLTWSANLNNQTNVPWVHSVSYGSQGDYPSDSYQARLEAEFVKLGARGVSVMLASGDSGACGDGGNQKKCGCSPLDPSFPATCPYVTSVGATKFLTGNTGGEGAVKYFGSGGGFSQVFPQEDWQADLVNAYLNATTQPPACAFNASGRATPDVAALGDVEFQIIYDGSPISIGGTSASSPTFASIISLLNDQQLNAGKSTLGYLNPWIYDTAAKSPGAFWDVTVGDNEGKCGTKGVQCGFLCAPGWDAVTGVGTPNYELLVNSLP